LQDAWRRWADAATLLCERIRPLQQGGGHVDGAHDLEHAIARARAALQVAPETLAAPRDPGERVEATVTGTAAIPVEETRPERSAADDAGAARVDLRASDAWVSEDLLELDRISADPARLRPGR
jgi:hypothetical protein